MSNLLKEAVADAKAIRELAYKNAKEALEEAFQPTIQRMISSKLNEEDDEMPEPEEEMPAPEPEVSDEGGEEDFSFDQESPEEEELNIEALIRELEGEEEQEEPIEEEEEDYLDTFSEGEGEDEEEVLESLLRELEGEEEEMEEGEGEEEYSELDEILRELEGSDDEEEMEPQTESRLRMENRKLKRKIQELTKSNKILKNAMSEAFLINSKLFHVNKTLKSAKNLTESQQIGILKAFDRAKTRREVELIYSAISESFKNPASSKHIMKESASSKIKAGIKGSVNNRQNKFYSFAPRLQEIAGINKK